MYKATIYLNAYAKTKKYITENRDIFTLKKEKFEEITNKIEIALIALYSMKSIEELEAQVCECGCDTIYYTKRGKKRIIGIIEKI